MKCPDCGFEIPEGCLLCENCGKEIQIVPDFEPEVENSMAETMSTVAENLITSEPEENKSDILTEQRSKRFLRVSGLVILILIFLTLAFSLSAYFSSPNYEMEKADKYIKQGDYKSALESLRKASDTGGDFVDIRFEMADLYQKEGDYDSFLNSLLAVINHDGASDESISQAYDQIVSYYASQKQYDAISSLLQNCSINAVREKYTAYMAAAPEFNYVEGSYSEVVPLKIIANTVGHIYYTMDGSTPDKHSKEYISPVFLNSGDYVVTAVFINQYGVVSPLSKSVYHIDVSAPFAPEVDAYSGEFYTPQMIHVDAADGCTVYYTTDGNDPTVNSLVYNGFLPMPLGKSTLKFIAVDESQNSSEITTRNYDLELMTNYTKDDAQTVILDYLVSQGKITDKTGKLANDPGKRMYYSFACCVTIADQGDFYIFSEYVLHNDGSKEKTGNYYAVGIYNLPLYNTQYDAKTGTFALAGAQLNPEQTQQ